MSLYKPPGSQNWSVRISHDGRLVRRSTGTADRREAEKTHLQIELELRRAPPRLKGLTWGKAVKLWLDDTPRSDSELLSLAKFGRLYPDRVLDAVTKESLQAALSFCKTPGTYTRYRTMLMAILNRAKAEDWITDVPKMVTKRVRPKARMWLTPEQWAALYPELPAHMRPMASFAIETGLRQANVLGLQWSKVSIERKVAWVEAEDAKGEVAIPVPLNDAALAVLEAQKGLHDDFVFVYRGKPVAEIKTAFGAACRRAGVPGFTWHGFRHTWATWHAQNGTPLDVLQKLGGWSDMRMLTENYAHHSPGYLAGYAGNNRKKAS
jgi:integrase